MRLLILGGTKFLGRHLVQAAMKQGHEITLFNRGKTNPAAYPELETLTGDRDGGLDALRGRHFDGVIDPSGYVPRVVRQSVELLCDAVQHYTFVSSISVYADFTTVGLDEDAPVGELDDADCEDIGRFYGPLKAACEGEVTRMFGEQALVIRPGLIVGPYDPTDRFTYWVRRFSQPGEVLLPGQPVDPVQFIDVRDLADWMISLVARRASGCFHAIGPKSRLTMGEFVASLQKVNAQQAHPLWVPEDFLLARDVQEWSDLPLWISRRTNWPGFQTVDISRAVANGLTFRSLADTIRDTLTWDSSRPQATPLAAGMSREREIALLREARM